VLEEDVVVDNVLAVELVVVVLEEDVVVDNVLAVELVVVVVVVVVVVKLEQVNSSTSCT